ncbi:hypothetical protein FB45DRAFT_1050018 [Roridomyces roridus]|uniref:F-box domain-containing protein n=1 Tax=Roridomyces roridus TaxID=1738132 RepID=A0AAD7CIA8_9AGAR|nr:hypothetical protein FB45DRAFT_1050018 [Roridomyces roridus]
MSDQEFMETIQTIAEISADMEHYGHAFHVLEGRKLYFQSRLNAICDPLSNLPLELSSKIFIHCLPDEPYLQLDGPSAPMLLLRICTAWSKIALSTPALWATIRATFPRERLLSQRFQRAGSHLFRLHFRGRIDPLVAALIWRHSGRVEHLHIFLVEPKLPERYRDDFFKISLRRMPPYHILSLDGQIPQPLPSLRVFSVRAVPKAAEREVNPSLILKIIRASPNLVELDLHGLALIGSQADIEPQIVLPNLRRFGYSADSPEVLNRISAPRLESLAIPFGWHSSLSIEGVFAFLQRSGTPPIRELEVQCFSRLDDLAALVPDLVHLRIVSPPVLVLEQHLTLLAEPNLSSNHFPNIHTLEILDHPSNFQAASTLLFSALTCRTAQLRTVRITLERFESFDAAAEGSASVLAPFQELLAGGMVIFLGDKNAERNLLCVSQS